MKVPQMEQCSSCGGHGVYAATYWNGDFDVQECRSCGGTGLTDKRDERGRFLPWVEAA